MRLRISSRYMSVEWTYKLKETSKLVSSVDGYIVGSNKESYSEDEHIVFVGIATRELQNGVKTNNCNEKELYLFKVNGIKEIKLQNFE